MTKTAAPQRIYGPKDIAYELGISMSAVSNAIHRVGNGTPAPTYVTGQDRMFWSERGLTAWRAWQAEYRTRRGWKDGDDQ